VAKSSNHGCTSSYGESWATKQINIMEVSMIATLRHIPIVGSELGRVPTFLVVHGQVQFNMGGFKGILPQGEEMFYKKHGLFVPEYVGDSYAVLHHVTVLKQTTKIFIPPRKRIYISDGRYTLIDVDYESFRRYSR
jgi:hypothetical protein